MACCRTDLCLLNCVYLALTRFMFQRYYSYPYYYGWDASLHVAPANLAVNVQGDPEKRKRSVSRTSSSSAGSSRVRQERRAPRDRDRRVRRQEESGRSSNHRSYCRHADSRLQRALSSERRLRIRAEREHRQAMTHAEIQRRISARSRAVVEDDRRVLQREVARLRSRLACQPKERLRLVSVKRKVAEVDKNQLAAVAALATPAAESDEVEAEEVRSEGAVIANSKPDDGERSNADDGSSSSSESDSDV